MDFGSEFVYSYSDSEEEEIPAEEIETGEHRDLGAEVQKPPVPKRRQGDGATASRSSAGQKWRCADTNVVVVKFDQLTAPSNMHTGDPIVCGGCQVMLSHISKIIQQGPKMIWTCEFCGENNKVDIVSEEVPSKSDVTYMLEPALVAAAGESGTSRKTDQEESIVVFCIDYSGSMSSVVARSGRKGITRLDGVKRAVCHQMERLAENSPGCRVAVVAFESDVKVIDDGKDIREHRISYDIFDDKTKLLEVATDLSLPSRISDSQKVLTQNVLREHTGGQTALGPGLLVSVGIARQMARSKVIVCTDGEANSGLGSLQNQETAYAFYTEVANIAKESGVSVSVLTISGTDCKLVELGRVAELTGGQVNIVDPEKATEEFGNILAEAIIATHATARFFVHRDLYIREEPDRPSHALRDIGNVTRGTEISFEYGVRRKKKPKTTSCQGTKKDDGGDDKRDEPDDDAVAVVAQTMTVAEDDNGQKHRMEPSNIPLAQESTNVPLAQDSSNATVTQEPSNVTKDEPSISTTPIRLPFQVQIHYTDSNGTKAVRVFTETKPVTKNRKEAERRMNIPIVGTHAIQAAAGMALKSQYMESRLTDYAHKRMFQRNAAVSDLYKRGAEVHEMASRQMQMNVIRAQRSEAMSNNSTVMDAEKMLQNQGYDEARKYRRQQCSDTFAAECYMGKKFSSRQFAKTASEPPPPLPVKLLVPKREHTPAVPQEEPHDQSKDDNENPFS